MNQGRLINSHYLLQYSLNECFDRIFALQTKGYALAETEKAGLFFGQDFKSNGKEPQQALFETGNCILTRVPAAVLTMSILPWLRSAIV